MACRIAALCPAQGRLLPRVARQCLFLRVLCVSVVPLLLADGAATAAETPKRGGTLDFSVEAEPPSYDCHANISFAFLHPVAPHYSTLLKFDGAAYPEIR